MQQFSLEQRYGNVKSQNWRGVKAIMHQNSQKLLHEKPTIAYCYQQYAPKIFDYTRKHVTSYEDAEDILVETFVAAFESEQFSLLAEKEQQAWLWRVAHNKVVDNYRRTKRHVPLSIVENELFAHDANGPEQISIQQEDDLQLRRLIQHLSPIQQQVLYLRFNDDLRCSQIASKLGKREGSVRSILSRTLNRLRELYTKV